MNKIVLWSLCAAFAVFLFGFDTVVISGAEKQLQQIWHSSDAFHGTYVIGMALWGTVAGAVFGGIPTNALGRKKSLFFIGILYVISALGSALVDDPITFGIFRFIGGLGVGASTIAAPAYISEIAPEKDRGRLVAFYQFNIVLGMLAAYASNYLLRDSGSEPWRWMVGMEALPALIYTFLVLVIPQSPRWLIAQGKIEKARSILSKIDTSKNLDDKIAEIKRQADHGKSSHETIFMKKYRKPLILAFLIAFFNQFSGINALLYYAPRIFEEAGLEESASLLSSIGVGVTNIIFTFLALFLIDRLGRRTLMFIGSIGYIISLSMVSAAFFLDWGGMSVPIFIFIFIAAHAIGQGSVIWVFISEIFPNHLRAGGQAFGSSTHWVLAAIIPSLVPVLFGSIGPGWVFACFAFMMVLQLLYVKFMMPETKGKSLEDLGLGLSAAEE